MMKSRNSVYVPLVIIYLLFYYLRTTIQAAGGAPHSMVGNMLEESDKNGTLNNYIESQIKYVSHALFGAGYESVCVA